MKVWVALIFIFLGAAGVRGAGLVHRAPEKTAAASNPLEGNPQAERAGAKLYAQECAACHGPNREGRKAPPLRLPEVQQAPAGVLFWVLRNGSLHTGMPSFAHLPEPERWQIVTFLHQDTNRSARANRW